MLVERYETLGGVCLNVGCIPSKALLHVARVITEAEEAGEPRHRASASREIDLDALRALEGRRSSASSPAAWPGWPSSARSRSCAATGTFASPNVLAVEGEDGTTTIGFDHCIIAAGSQRRRSCRACPTTTRA